MWRVSVWLFKTISPFWISLRSRKGTVTISGMQWISKLRSTIFWNGKDSISDLVRWNGDLCEFVVVGLESAVFRGWQKRNWEPYKKKSGGHHAARSRIVSAIADCSNVNYQGDKMLIDTLEDGRWNRISNGLELFEIGVPSIMHRRFSFSYNKSILFRNTAGLKGVQKEEILKKDFYAKPREYMWKRRH